MTKEKDPDERVQFGSHWGDWSVPIIAVFFLIAFLAFLSTDFLAGLEKTDQVLNRIQADNIAKAEKKLDRSLTKTERKQFTFKPEQLQALRELARIPRKNNLILGISFWLVIHGSVPDVLKMACFRQSSMSR